MPSLGQRLLQTLFAGAAYMDNRHWKTFIPTVMKPLVINCPAGFDGAVLEPILSFFFDFFNSKLDTEWKALTERGIRLDKSEDELVLRAPMLLFLGQNSHATVQERMNLN